MEDKTKNAFKKNDYKQIYIDIDIDSISDTDTDTDTDIDTDIDIEPKLLPFYWM